MHHRQYPSTDPCLRRGQRPGHAGSGRSMEEAHASASAGSTAATFVCAMRACSRSLASASRSWVVNCDSRADGLCYYDCSDAPSCMHSIAPVLSERVSNGRWYRVPLPSEWTAFSLLLLTS